MDLLRRQRVVILAALAAVAALAWLYLILAAADMTAAMAGMHPTKPHALEAKERREPCTPRL